MAEKVLGSNMQKLVNAMRMAIQHGNTTLDVEYRRTMLSEAHILAVECKNFLQAVDSARIQAGVAKFVAKKRSNANSIEIASTSSANNVADDSKLSTTTLTRSSTSDEEILIN